MLGIHRDTNPVKQPDNTYRYANNLHFHLNELTSEEANELCVDFPEEIVGSIPLNNDEFVIFTPSVIYLFKSSTCEKQVITDCITNNTIISGISRTLSDCGEREIYWSDGTFKWLNIEKILSGENDPCDVNLFNCNLPTSLKVSVLNSGGALYSGAYQFAYKYPNSNWQYITNVVPIYEDELSSKFPTDGNDYSVTSNKSIKLDIINPDYNQDYIEIAVIKTINSIVSVEIIGKVNVTDQFIYTGNQGTTISLNEFLVNLSYYQSGNLVHEFQNNLLIGDLKSIQNINYQQFANNIEVEWFTSQIPTNYRLPEFYQYRTFMGDEIYALGIMFEFCDGSLSPVYHIPGRAATFFDRTIIDGENEDNFFGCDKETWEVYNTSVILDAPHEESTYTDNCGIIEDFKTNVWESGRLGYNEQCIRYPDIKDCDGNYMYPHTINPDGTVIMDFIRHHRIPDRTLVPHFKSREQPDVECLGRNTIPIKPPYQDMFIYPIGLRFKNIVMPDTSIPVLRYHIVIGERNEANKSVIAKGFLHKCFATTLANGNIAAHPHYNINATLNSVFGFNNYNGSISGYSDISSANVITTEETTINKFHSPNTSYIKPYLNGTYFNTEQEWLGRGRVYGTKEPNSIDEDTYCIRYNFDMSKYDYNTNMLKGNNQNKNRKIVNQSYLRPNINITDAFSLTFINLHQESGVGLELDTNLRLDLPCVDCSNYFICYPEYRDDSLLYWNIEPWRCVNTINCSRGLYGAIKRHNCNQYGETISYRTAKISNNMNSTIDVFGDAFINYWSYRRTAVLNYAQSLVNEVPSGGVRVPLSTLVHGWYESDINVDLRHGVYYPEHKPLDFDPIGNFDSDNSFTTEFHWNNETKTYVNLGIDNDYQYNLDYSTFNNPRVNFHIDRNFKTCECNNLLENTIHISTDFRTFKYNDKIEVPFTYGKMMNIFSLSNDLYVHTTDNIWKVFTSQSQLQTDNGTVYIGNAQLANSLPLYMYASEQGVAGLQQHGGTLINQYGYHFYDNKEGIVYRFDGSIKPLSNGLFEYFRNHKDMKWHFGYDYQNNRLLLTGKHINTCKDFTISKYEPSDLWTSFHDYIPSKFLQTRTNLFSIFNSGIYEHNIPYKYQYYYGIYYPAIIETVDTSNAVQVWKNDMYLQNAYSWNGSAFKNEDKTFTQCVLYNSKQNSGILSLTPYEDLNYFQYDDTITKVNRKEHKWYINEFIDNVNDYSVPHHYYPCNEPIDFTVDANVQPKSIFDSQMFRDFYFIKRYWFSHNENIKMVYTTDTNIKQQSIR